MEVILEESVQVVFDLDSGAVGLSQYLILHFNLLACTDDSVIDENCVIFWPQGWPREQNFSTFEQPEAGLDTGDSCSVEPSVQQLEFKELFWVEESGDLVNSAE